MNDFVELIKQAYSLEEIAYYERLVSYLEFEVEVAKATEITQQFADWLAGRYDLYVATAALEAVSGEFASLLDRDDDCETPDNE